MPAIETSLLIRSQICRVGLDWIRRLARNRCGLKASFAVDIGSKNKVMPLLRETIVLKGCGHWTQQERAKDVNNVRQTQQPLRPRQSRRSGGTVRTNDQDTHARQIRDILDPVVCSVRAGATFMADSFMGVSLFLKWVRWTFREAEGSNLSFGGLTRTSARFRAIDWTWLIACLEVGVCPQGGQCQCLVL